MPVETGLRGAFQKYVDFCHNFFSRRHITVRFWYTQLTTITRYLSNMTWYFENNQPYVSVKWSHRAWFDCVVYNIYTIDGLLQFFLKLVTILNNFFMWMYKIILLFHQYNIEAICQLFVRIRLQKTR